MNTDLSEKIKKWSKNKDIFVYFNNDAYGYAIENAKELLKLCGFWANNPKTLLGKVGMGRTEVGHRKGFDKAIWWSKM